MGSEHSSHASSTRSSSIFSASSGSRSSTSTDYESPRRKHERDHLMELFSSLMTADVEMKNLIEVVETFLKLLKQLQRLRIPRAPRASRKCYPSEASTAIRSLSGSFDGMITPPNHGFAPKRPDNSKSKRPLGCFPKLDSNSVYTTYGSDVDARKESNRSWDSQATLNDSAYVGFSGFGNNSTGGEDDDDDEDYTESVYLSSNDSSSSHSSSCYLDSQGCDCDCDRDAFSGPDPQDYLNLGQFMTVQPDLYRDRFFGCCCDLCSPLPMPIHESEPEEDSKQESTPEADPNSMSSDDLGSLFDEDQEEKVSGSRSLDNALPPNEDSPKDKKSHMSSRSS